MDIFTIIMIGLLLTLTGTAVLMVLPPVFGLPYKLTVKRTVLFAVGFELLLAVLFCCLNGVRPTVMGQFYWHLGRIVQICLLCVYNRKLLASVKKNGRVLWYTIVAGVLAQVVQYIIILQIY